MSGGICTLRQSIIFKQPVYLLLSYIRSRSMEYILKEMGDMHFMYERVNGNLNVLPRRMHAGIQSTRRCPAREKFEATLKHLKECPFDANHRLWVYRTSESLELSRICQTALVSNLKLEYANILQHYVFRIRRFRKLSTNSNSNRSMCSEYMPSKLKITHHFCSFVDGFSCSETMHSFVPVFSIDEVKFARDSIIYSYCKH